MSHHHHSGERHESADIRPSNQSGASLRERLQRGLYAARKQRDGAGIQALSSVLTALDNAGAVPPSALASAAPKAACGQVSEVPRRELSEAESAAIVRAEIAERDAAIADYERLRCEHEAAALRAEREILVGFLGGEGGL